MVRRSLTAFSDEGDIRDQVGHHFLHHFSCCRFFWFTEVASDAKGIAKILFYIALAIFLIVLVFGVFLGMLVF